MPCKNVVKTYSENCYYHIYNRGVNKERIFRDAQDYSVFLSYLRIYLLPKDEINLKKSLLDKSIGYQEKDKILKLLRLNNFFGEIVLLAYCLMINHFHFLIKQKNISSIDYFMKSLCTRYTMYFNKKYHRVGPLYQSTYKAVIIESDEQLLYLSSYIHRNPFSEKSSDLFSQPSSLPEYLGQKKTEWTHPEEILGYFSKTNPKFSYETFVNQTEDLSLIINSIID